MDPGAFGSCGGKRQAHARAGSNSHPRMQHADKPLPPLPGPCTSKPSRLLLPKPKYSYTCCSRMLCPRVPYLLVRQTLNASRYHCTTSR